MPRPQPSYPDSVWDGDTVNPDRDCFEHQAPVTAEDYERVASELVAVQEHTYNHHNLFRVPTLFTAQWEKNQKTGVNTLGGGLTNVVTAGTLNSGNNIVIAAKNMSRLMLVVNTAGDAEGTITITGNRLDSSNGTKVAGTETITLTGVSQDNTSNTTAGTPKWDIAGAYQTLYSFCDEVTINTTDCNISDIDIYNFWNFLQPALESLTVDALSFAAVPTNATAQADCILYGVTIDDNNTGKRKCTIAPIHHIEIDGTFGVHQTDNLIAIQRVGTLATLTPTNFEGLFLNVAFYPAALQYWESVLVSVWTSWYYKQTPTPIHLLLPPGLS